MSIGDFLHRVWYGKPRYTPEEALLMKAKDKRASLLRHLIAYGGINGGLVAINFMSNGLDSFWAGYPIVIWGAFFAISGMRYWLWLSDNKKDLAHAEKVVALMRKAELSLLERSARSKAITERVSADELMRLTTEQVGKAKEALATLGPEHGDMVGLIDSNLGEIRQLCGHLKPLEQYLDEEDLAILTREQAALQKRLMETQDAATKRELESSLDTLAQRATKLKELAVESERIRARIQAFWQTVEAVRTSATSIKTAEVQKGTGADTTALSNGVDKLRRELQTMQKVHEELASIDFSDAALRAKVQSLRAQ
jgi:hypothetical protein